MAHHRVSWRSSIQNLCQILIIKEAAIPSNIITFTTIIQQNTKKTYEQGTSYKYIISLKTWLMLTLLTRLDLQLITEKFPRPTKQENNTKITITSVKLSPYNSSQPCQCHTLCKNYQQITILGYQHTYPLLE